MIRKLFFLKNNGFPQNAQLDTQIGFSKTPPESFFTRGRKLLFSISRKYWKNFPKNASKNSFVHIAFDSDNNVKKPLPDGRSFVDQCPKRRIKIFENKSFPPTIPMDK